jgi:hypothetical protein
MSKTKLTAAYISIADLRYRIRNLRPHYPPMYVRIESLLNGIIYRILDNAAAVKRPELIYGIRETD